MKPIIAIDLDGALMYSRPFEEAHKKWFEVMAKLLKDNSIKQYAKIDNYFPKVHEVMKRYLGNVSKESQNRFARNLYGMSTVSEVRASDSVKEFVSYLKKIKNKYQLALITSIPEISADPILEKIKCSDLFDYVYASPIERQPSKKELLKQFLKEQGKISFYIGNGDKDIASCKDLKIKSISVNWVSKGKFKGDYDINSVKELEKIIQ